MCTSFYREKYFIAVKQMKRIIFAVGMVSIATASYAQNVGIGTTTPKAALNVAAGATVLFGANITGSGNKVIWHPALGAFRAGTAYGNEFDYANVGLYSVALGHENSASGAYSFATGSNNTASGEYTTQWALVRLPVVNMLLPRVRMQQQ